MFDIFEKIDYSKDILWMIDNEYLVEPKVIQIGTRTCLDEVKTVAGEFNQKELELTVNTDYRNDLIVKAWREYAEDRKHTLIFCSGIKHSSDLSEEFKRNGISCESIDSTLDQKDRENVISRFRSGDIKVLCNVGVLTTGFDMAAVDCIVYARPTKSKILFAQILGRGLRLNENKENCLVLDFKDVATRHDLLSMDDFFVVNFKNGETYRDAKERCINEMAKLIEEQRKREEARQKNLEVYAIQIKMFNREMNKAFLNVYYDWYKINNNLWVVNEGSNLCFGVLSFNNEFSVLRICTEKDKQSVREINVYENITEAIEWIENKIVNPKSFAYKDATWKKEPITDGQRKYCPWAKNKWEVSKFFTKNTINRLVEKYLVNQSD
jgi:type I site-specific restriction endonuclease